MINVIITEIQKLKRYSILWAGIIVVMISPLMAVFTQKMYIVQNPNYGFESLINDTIWNNMGMIFPSTIALIGGYMINREYIDNTLKNSLPIPISFRRLLIGKIFTLGIVTVLFGAYSFLITLICSVVFFPTGITLFSAVKGFMQIVSMALFIYVAELPVIAFCGRKPNMFMGGVIVSFVYGYFSIFLSGENLQDIYPMSAGLGIIGFTGDTGSDIITYSPLVGCVVLLTMIIVTALILIPTKKNYN
ncbi:ABC transporter permease [Haloimpatiens sp. FM7330]|uniref:ABC transporter permease n=1 Tax=Haloimpatiens sp. FM7330 TaxID=3298610 RepID=UPI003632B124